MGNAIGPNASARRDCSDIRPTRYDDAGLVAVLVVADGRVDSDDNAAERQQPSWRNEGGFDVR